MLTGSKAAPGSDHEKCRSCVPLTRFTSQGSGAYAATGKNWLPRVQNTVNAIAQENDGQIAMKW